MYDAIIFGGILRDAYSGEHRYKDIDVIALPGSKKCLMQELTRLGWKEDEDLEFSGSGYNERAVYRNTSDLSLPAIDLVDSPEVNRDSHEAWRAAWVHAANVDIRCNAIAWTPTSGVMALPDAVDDCKRKNIHILRPSDKTPGRIEELEKRGWKNSSSLGNFSRKGYPF